MIKIITNPNSNITIPENFVEAQKLVDETTRGIFDVSVFDNAYFDALGLLSFKTINTPNSNVTIDEPFTEINALQLNSKLKVINQG